MSLVISFTTHSFFILRKIFKTAVVLEREVKTRRDCLWNTNFDIRCYCSLSCCNLRTWRQSWRFKWKWSGFCWETLLRKINTFLVQALMFPRVPRFPRRRRKRSFPGFWFLLSLLLLLFSVLGPQSLTFTSKCFIRHLTIPSWWNWKFYEILESSAILLEFLLQYYS